MIYGANGSVPGVWLAQRGRRRRRSMGPALILIGIALGAAVAYVAGDPILDRATRVRRVEIDVRGPGVVTTEEVARILSLPPVFSWRDLNPPALVARLRAEPRIAAARIEYVWFQRLIVAVEERAAVAMIVGPGGRVLEVATDGLLLEARGTDVADLPLLTWDDFLLREMPEAGAILDLPGAPDLTDLLRQLQIAQPGLWSGVSEAHLCADGTYEIFWNEAPTVIWGRGRMGSTRLQAWATVMEDLRRRGEKDVVVDLRFRDQVVVRRPTPPPSTPARPLG